MGYLCESAVMSIMQAQSINITKLVVNTGQIEGLPKNPRFIRDERFAKLVKSIQDDPEMMALRELLVYPTGKEFVVIGGNMRLRALKELGYKEAPCKVLDKATPVEKLRAYTIKDNIGFGDHDWDQLANEWDAVELSDWGLDVPIGQDFSDKNQEIDTDGFADESVIKLTYSLEDYEKVREALSKVAATPEQAVWKLLNL
jgi:hypothetical protein